ncbi:MAG: hypothetical protein ACK53L_20650, partial [Pirellulaceae bacterium]
MNHFLKPYFTGCLLALGCLVQTGCVGITSGINLGPFGVPIPVSPYFQDQEELEFHIHERYARVPIMG